MAHASTAYLFNLLPSICLEPDKARFERLLCHFRAALVAYGDGQKGWCPIPEPLANGGHPHTEDRHEPP